MALHMAVIWIGIAFMGNLILQVRVSFDFHLGLVSTRVVMVWGYMGNLWDRLQIPDDQQHNDTHNINFFFSLTCLCSHENIAYRSTYS